ncbi:MAG: sulfotransferase family 2 domain-containing protein [Anaerolineales bacterium]|nr:sulfotransferase family 2 domain-containing protein [Anaerolineales bacterium]
MLISHSHRFIFIHIYKVAGMSVRNALDAYATKPDIVNRLFYKLGLKIASPFQPCRMFPFHARAKLLKQGLPARIYDTYYKFAFVRNPWDWQVSLYHFMLQDPTHFQHELLKSMSGFGEYIEWRVSEDKNLQKDFVTDDNGKLIVDFVGRYERLADDFRRVCAALKIDATLPHINRSSHKDYRSYYDERSRKMVEEHFAEDIELFGYSFDGLRV